MVLGLRTLPLVGGVMPLDATVPLAGLSDRFARRAATGDATTRLPVPPTTVAPAWAAVSPPRAGWEPVGLLPVADLLEAARAGIEEVAQGAPTGSGASAVAALRARVWGRPLVAGVPPAWGWGCTPSGSQVAPVRPVAPLTPTARSTRRCTGPARGSGSRCPRVTCWRGPEPGRLSVAAARVQERSGGATACPGRPSGPMPAATGRREWLLWRRPEATAGLAWPCGRRRPV